MPTDVLLVQREIKLIISLESLPEMGRSKGDKNLPLVPLIFIRSAKLNETSADFIWASPSLELFPCVCCPEGINNSPGSMQDLTHVYMGGIVLFSSYREE